MNIHKVVQVDGGFKVSHFVTGDPNPTPTEQTFTSQVDAINNGILRAARLALLSGKAGVLVVPSGNQYLVEVTNIEGEKPDEPL